MSSLNRALRLLRTYHHITQVDLAKRLDISNSYLSEIEKGDKAPTFGLLEKYAEVFNMPISSILLFSEIDATGERPGQIKAKATDKILRLLEWIDERDKVSGKKE